MSRACRVTHVACGAARRPASRTSIVFVVNVSSFTLITHGQIQYMAPHCTRIHFVGWMDECAAPRACDFGLKISRRAAGHPTESRSEVVKQCFTSQREDQHPCHLGLRMLQAPGRPRGVPRFPRARGRRSSRSHPVLQISTVPPRLAGPSCPCRERSSERAATGQSCHPSLDGPQSLATGAVVSVK